jgi:hypothetical protein
MKKKNSNENSLKDFIDALDEIQKTKGIEKEELISAVEAALISAYNKEYRGGENVRVEMIAKPENRCIYLCVRSQNPWKMRWMKLRCPKRRKSIPFIKSGMW